MIVKMSVSVIEVQNLSFGYGTKPILNNINLKVNAGDFLGLIGPNGSAKTTFIKLTLGIIKPWRGQIRLFGQDITVFKRWDKIGYLAQRAASVNIGFPATVEEIVAANLYRQIGRLRALKKTHQTKVQSALETVGLINKRKCLIGNLSGGEVQKVFIARALVNEPELFLLDEPTVGVDLKGQEGLYELLDRLNKQWHITVILISHDVGVVTARVKRLACLNDTQIFVFDQPFDFLSSPDNLAKVYGQGMQTLIHCHQVNCKGRSFNA